MGLRRVGHDWGTSLSLSTFMHWRRKWQPTPVFLPGESQGWGAWWAAVYGVAQSRTRLMWLSLAWASQVAQWQVPIQESWVQSLVGEDTLQKGIATHSSILAWRIPWTEEPGGYSPQSHKQSDTIERLTLSLSSTRCKDLQNYNTQDSAEFNRR